MSEPYVPAEQRTGPLEGTTVLELGHIVAGPFCSLIFADLGADVIKVENRARGGDSVRNSSELGTSLFNAMNRNKRSITLNLKSAEGLAVFEQLVADADILVENFAPGVTQRLSVDYESLKEINSSLIYCSISGFGDGPYKDYPALDPVTEALSGLMSVTGLPGEQPVRVGTSISDMAASFFGAIGVLSALRTRDQTGDGALIEAPMFESTLPFMSYWLAYTQTHDIVPEPIGASHLNWAPYDVFQTQEGAWTFIGPTSQRHWTKMCEALDFELTRDDRFATAEARRNHRKELRETLASKLQHWDQETVLTRLREAGVPTAPINDVSDVVEDEHLNATDALTEISTVEGLDARINVPKSPIRSDQFDPPEGEAPPALGEHTDSVLRELGYDESEITLFRENGVI